MVRFPLQNHKATMSTDQIPPEPDPRVVAELEKQLEYIKGQETKLQATYTEGSKGLTLLNSGAVAAMLALTQSLIGRGVFSEIKPYSVAALAIFLCGAICASSIFFALVYRITSSVAAEPTGDRSYAFATKALLLSMACFILGSTVITIGLAVS